MFAIVFVCLCVCVFLFVVVYVLAFFANVTHEAYECFYFLCELSTKMCVDPNTKAILELGIDMCAIGSKPIFSVIDERAIWCFAHKIDMFPKAEKD